MISVIMSVFNEKEEWVKESIISILNQTYKEFEFIITLDNPNNKQLDKLIEKLKEKDDRIIYIKNKENMGLVWSLNNMLKIAKGEFIARMDADDIALKNRFEEQIKYINERHIDLLGSNIIVFDENKEYKKNVLVDHEELKNNMGGAIFIPHPTWLVRSFVYNKLNGYRDIYLAEDYDFILRAIKAKFKLGNINKVLLKYRMNANGISRTNALKQKLTSIYLYDNFYRIEEITQNELGDYLKRVNEKEATKYSIGEKYFNKLKEERNVILKIYILFVLVFKYNIYLKYNKVRNLKLKIKNKVRGSSYSEEKKYE